MVFGSIEYLNLLPFYTYIRKNVTNSQFKKIMEYRRGVPSEINRLFRKRRVDYAFISSIASGGYRCSNLGIIAPREVQSVLLIEGEESRDSDSETSNRLAEVLKLKGRVIIGDKALRYHLKGGKALDLAEEWYNKQGLPFVFAKLCYHKNHQFMEKLSRDFKRPHIPRYILKRASESSSVKITDILGYLDKIEYRCSPKSRKSLQKFRDS
jgi:chorismate dehydratase